MATIIDFSELIYCECGCGTQIPKYDWKGRPRKYLNRSHSGRSTFLGKKHSDETKQKISKEMTGKQGYWLGKPIPKEIIEKQIQTKKERYIKENHPMYGKRHSEETKKKISLARTKPVDQRTIRIRNGYRYLFKPDHPNADHDGHIGEHVFVMSEYLGRPLKKGEHVHHINKNRMDNEIKNLKLFTNSQHMREHMIEYWKNKKR